MDASKGKVKDSVTAKKLLKKRISFKLSLAVVLVCMITGTVFAVFSSITADRQAAERNVRYIVDRGDTLWDIASEYGNGKNTGELVHKIRKLNGLGDCVIRSGEVIYIPCE